MRIFVFHASIWFKKVIKAKRIKVNTVTEKQCKNCADFDVTFLPLGKGQKSEDFCISCVKRVQKSDKV